MSIRERNRRKTDWMRDSWRPLMAITYMAICIFDFIAGPIFFNVLQVYAASPIVMWAPLTLGGGGLFHIAMGAVLGVTAWTRGQEKIIEIEQRSNASTEDYQNGK